MAEPALVVPRTARYPTTSWDMASLWGSRLSRLRAFARLECRRARVPYHAIDVDDLVQDAVAAWLRGGVVRHEVLSPAAMETVRKAIAHAEGASRTRPRPVEPAKLDRVARMAEEPPLDAEDEEDLRAAIGALPAHLRPLAEARLLGARPLPTYAELARARGCTTGNVQNLSLRAARLVVQKIRHRRAVRSRGPQNGTSS